VGRTVAVAGVPAPSCQAVCECPLRQDALQSAKFRSSAAALQSLWFDALFLCRPQTDIFRVRVAKRASTGRRRDQCVAAPQQTSVAALRHDTTRPAPHIFGRCRRRLRGSEQTVYAISNAWCVRSAGKKAAVAWYAAQRDLTFCRRSSHSRFCRPRIVAATVDKLVENSDEFLKAILQECLPRGVIARRGQ